MAALRAAADRAGPGDLRAQLRHLDVVGDVHQLAAHHVGHQHVDGVAADVDRGQTHVAECHNLESPWPQEKRTRMERDSMGEMEVPADAYYGASTQRAVLNFPISGQPFPRRFIRALGLIKKAAAQTNRELGLLAAPARARDRRRRAGGDRRQARRPVPDRHLPDRLRHVDQHQRQRGHRQPRHRDPRRASAARRSSTPTTT